MNVFSAEWFEARQAWLLLALNLPILGSWLRSKLGLNHKGRVTKVLPHACFREEGGRGCATFYPGPFYAFELHRSLTWFWSLLHAWDATAGWLVPALDVGFATFRRDFTQPYQSGNGDGYFCRGWMTNNQNNDVNETFSVIIAGAGQTFSGGEAFMYPGIHASTTTNQFRGCSRGFLQFDTSALGAIGASPYDAILSLWAVDLPAQQLGGTPSVVVAGFNPANSASVAVTDFVNCGSTAYASALLSSVSTFAYNLFDLTNVSAINVAGLSQFSLRMDWDINGAFTGTWVSNSESSWTPISWDGYVSDPSLRRPPALAVLYSILDVAVQPNGAVAVVPGRMTASG